MSRATSFLPKGYHTVTPQLTLDQAARTIEWYKKALGAQEIDRNIGPDGKIMHAELKIGDSHFMVSDVMMGKGPKGFGGSPAGFWIYVADSDASFKRAVDAGAKPIMPPTDMFWGDRYCKLADPFGHHWSIATHEETLTPEEMTRRGQEAMKQFAK